jgi:hypothetical protein
MACPGVFGDAGGAADGLGGGDDSLAGDAGTRSAIGMLRIRHP